MFKKVLEKQPGEARTAIGAMDLCDVLKIGWQKFQVGSYINGENRHAAWHSPAAL